MDQPNEFHEDEEGFSFSSMELQFSEGDLSFLDGLDKGVKEVFEAMLEAVNLALNLNSMYIFKEKLEAQGRFDEVVEAWMYRNHETVSLLNHQFDHVFQQAKLAYEPLTMLVNVGDWMTGIFMNGQGRHVGIPLQNQFTACVWMVVATAANRLTVIQDVERGRCSMCGEDTDHGHTEMVEIGKSYIDAMGRDTGDDAQAGTEGDSNVQRPQTAEKEEEQDGNSDPS